VLFELSLLLYDGTKKLFELPAVVRLRIQPFIGGH
jgi:hypothetical protein